ncbi:hypothetical protein Clacol_005009 [Clathrus columnatus]|uniref:Uncharacterized protein n=1 Tax=Clathrus columnatus TaxID=1419009 RepID=A0AAV5ACN9_9AGAM|nr:hypothetical protein Clacol_005009 [Clathrus columnatus]
MYHLAQQQAVQIIGANAHCTVISQILDETKLQLENERKKKMRQSTKVKAQFITLPDLKAAFNKQDEELHAQEQIDAEKQAQKNANKAALQAKVTGDAKSRLQEKVDLIMITCALGLSQDGTISELTNQIKSHLELHPDLHTDPRFTGLFRIRHPRAAVIENNTLLNSNELSQAMLKYPDIPIDPLLY